MLSFAANFSQHSLKFKKSILFYDFCLFSGTRLLSGSVVEQLTSLSFPLPNRFQDRRQFQLGLARASCKYEKQASREKVCERFSYKAFFLFFFFLCCMWQTTCATKCETAYVETLKRLRWFFFVGRFFRAETFFWSELLLAFRRANPRLK